LFIKTGKGKNKQRKMDTIVFHQKYIPNLKWCARLYEELKNYNLNYPINFSEILKNMNPNTKLSDLPKNLRGHSHSMHRLMLPYKYPNFGIYFLMFIVVCFIAYIIPNRHQKGKQCALILAVTSGIAVMFYTILRFDIQS